TTASFAAEGDFSSKINKVSKINTVDKTLRRGWPSHFITTDEMRVQIIQMPHCCSGTTIARTVPPPLQ
ncbi:hypothetical protein E4U54_003140, partial [Claviceps lovelessii]